MAQQGRLLIVVVALLARCGQAMMSGGSVVLKQNGTVFLEKFCFTFRPEGDHSAGWLNLTVHVPMSARGHHIQTLLFDDEVGSYTGPSSGWDQMSCKERRAHAKEYMDVDWRLASRPQGQRIIYRITQKLRPRWWYVALSDCTVSAPTEDLDVRYRVHTWNPAYGLLAEFSTDRRFTLHLLVPLAVAYFGLVAAQWRANRQVAQRAGDDSASGKAAHPFARLLSAGVLLGLAETVLSTAHAVRYALDGTGAPAVAVAAQLLATTSNFVLASLMLLVSEGKCVSYIMVTGDVWRMFRLLGPFLVSCCGLELWGEYALSQTYTTDYVYTTPIGWALILLDVVLLGVYARNLRTTLVAERGQADGVFYQTWGVVYGLWFLALPLTAILAQAVLAPYVWLIVSLGVKKGSTALVYAALVVGLWPGNSRTYFKLEPSSAEAIRSRLTTSCAWSAPAPRSSQASRSSAPAPTPAPAPAPAAAALPKPLPGLLGGSPPKAVLPELQRHLGRKLSFGTPAMSP